MPTIRLKGIQGREGNEIALEQQIACTFTFLLKKHTYERDTAVLYFYPTISWLFYMDFFHKKKGQMFRLTGCFDFRP